MNNTYIINKEDIKNRIYFITKLVQNQKGTTMQGALTSKSDMMGGIFDRFINTLSDALVFNKIIFQEKAFDGLKIRAVEDFYYYKPSNQNAGIAPDIFGIEVDGVTYPFTKFDNGWRAEPGMPQIEVKTFKAKDQMISLRNQGYDDEYLIFVDLDMRIDYLVPFLDKKILNKNMVNSMVMDDSLFIVKDNKQLIKRIDPIDFKNDEIGKLMLISVTNAKKFMQYATKCGSKVSVYRMKEIKERGTKVVKGLLHDKLSNYAKQNNNVKELYKFNAKWEEKMKVPKNTKCLAFSADNIKNIKIIKYNKNGIVIASEKEGCTFNGTEIKVGKQYTINFAVLDRSANEGTEFFMQKNCACYLPSLESELICKIMSIIQ